MRNGLFPPFPSTEGTTPRTTVRILAAGWNVAGLEPPTADFLAESAPASADGLADAIAAWLDPRSTRRRSLELVIQHRELVTQRLRLF